MTIYQIENFSNFEFSKLLNLKNLLIFEIEQFQKFDYFTNLAIMEI